MSIEKELRDIRSEIRDIKSLIGGTLESKAKKFDELEWYLSQIEINVKNIVPVPSEDGKVDLKIIYDISPVIVKFDDNGQPINNEVFKAINMLNLVDSESMDKIINAITQRSKIN